MTIDEIEDALAAEHGFDPTPPNDLVNHPPHYTSSGARCECGRPIECIQVTEWMNFNRGNSMKYNWRAGLKGDAITDLRKSIWYLEREIERLTRGEVE